MDPLGLALEHFDAVGQWRAQDSARAPIDATGTLPDGTPFDGPVGLRRALLSHPERFVSTVTEKLLTYALGRGLEYYDAPTIRAITRALAQQDYAFSSMILQVVRSTVPDERIGNGRAAGHDDNGSRGWSLTTDRQTAAAPSDSRSAGVKERVASCS
jgi:hypothetical protein